MKNNSAETLVFTCFFLRHFIRNGYRVLLALKPRPRCYTRCSSKPEISGKRLLYLVGAFRLCSYTKVTRERILWAEMAKSYTQVTDKWLQIEYFWVLRAKMFPKFKIIQNYSLGFNRKHRILYWLIFIVSDVFEGEIHCTQKIYSMLTKISASHCISEPIRRA